MLNNLYEEQNCTLTENGGAAYRSTGSECLNLFSFIGAIRGAADAEIERLFVRAFAENSDYALRIAFYARDVRGGLGERRIFRVIIRYLAVNAQESVKKNLHLFAEYGRYDDLLALFGTPCENAACALVKNQLEADEESMKNGKSVSLLSKWLPSVNASSAETRANAKTLCRYLKITEAAYRKRLSALRGYIDVLEKRLCKSDYSFDYERQPSGAMFKYRQAFYRNDEKRYCEYMTAVQSGEKKLHAGTLYPYEIIRETMKENLTEQQKSTLEATWRALPDYTDGRNAIAVIDGSYSMYGDLNGSVLPITVATSLGIYFAERNTGYFRNHFITFSCSPRLVALPDGDIFTRARYCMSYHEAANTDLYEVFMLLLITAVKNKLPQSELPETVYIISDMEFDYGVNPDETVYEDAKEKFEDYGYRLPNVVYWNVEARNEQFPVEQHENGTALISGASPSLFRFAITQETTPEAFMKAVLNTERYINIYA